MEISGKYGWFNQSKIVPVSPVKINPRRTSDVSSLISLDVLNDIIWNGNIFEIMNSQKSLKESCPISNSCLCLVIAKQQTMLGHQQAQCWPKSTHVYVKVSLAINGWPQIYVTHMTLFKMTDNISRNPRHVICRKVGRNLFKWRSSVLFISNGIFVKHERLYTSM